MNVRKRKNPSPHFKLTPPYNPVTGQHEPLQAVKGQKPICAMMQVAAEDTHDDYVVCRGFDPEAKRFFDYIEGDPDKIGLLVGKPYGVRGTYPYEIGQVFPAVKPVTKLGETPGVAAESTGHPADLDETIDILYAGSRVVSWILLDSVGSTASIWFELKTALPIGGMSAALNPGNSTIAHPQDWNGGAWVTDTDEDREFSVVDIRGVWRGRGIDDLEAPNTAGSVGRAKLNEISGEWEIRELTPMAIILVGLVDESEADVAHTDATFAVSDLEVMQPHGGLMPEASLVDPNEARNILRFPSVDAYPVLLFWNETDRKWDAIPRPDRDTCT